MKYITNTHKNHKHNSNDRAQLWFMAPTLIGPTTWWRKAAQASVLK